MQDLIIFLLIGAVTSFILAMPIMRSKPKTSMALLILLPPLSVLLYVPLSLHQYAQHVEIQGTQETETQKTDEALTEQLETNPDDTDTMLKLAHSYIAQERFDEAIALLSGPYHSTKDPEIAEPLSKAYFAKGLLYAENEDYSQALFLLRVAKTTAPEGSPYLADLEVFIKKVIEKRAQQ